MPSSKQIEFTPDPCEECLVRAGCSITNAGHCYYWTSYFIENPDKLLQRLKNVSEGGIKKKLWTENEWKAHVKIDVT